MGTPRKYIACNPELKRLFMTHQMPEEEVDEVAKPLFEEVGVETVHHYLGYFAQIPIIEFWRSQVGWATRGALLAYLRSSFFGFARCRVKYQGKGKVDAGLDPR